LKKKISAIKENLIAQKHAEGKHDGNKTSSSAETTPAPASMGGGGGIRRRGQTITQNQNQTQTPSQPAPTPVRSVTYSGVLSTTRPTLDTVGVVSAPPGAVARPPSEGYGSFGLTPPLAESGASPYGRHDAPNSPPEMTLPPPIKSISDLRINELRGDADLGKDGEIVSSPDQVSMFELSECA